jgi:hypothetical protein
LLTGDDAQLGKGDVITYVKNPEGEVEAMRVLFKANDKSEFKRDEDGVTLISGRFVSGQNDMVIYSIDPNNQDFYLTNDATIYAAGTSTNDSEIVTLSGPLDVPANDYSHVFMRIVDGKATEIILEK